MDDTPRRPNVLVLLADQLRAGSLPVYGETQIHTPNIDRLAQEGVTVHQRHLLLPGLHAVSLNVGHGAPPADNGPSDQLRADAAR